MTNIWIPDGLTDTPADRQTPRRLLKESLEPIDLLRQLETASDTTGRLALLEETKGLPFGAVWDDYCLRQGTPVGYSFMDAIRRYETRVLAQRG